MYIKYTTLKTTGLVVFTIGAIGLGIAILSSPQGYQIDAVVIIIAVVLTYIFFDIMWGSYVSIENNYVIRTNNFFVKKRIAISEIESVRYQPTYGVGREASTLYLFNKNQNTAAFTMTSLWFGEEKLRDFAGKLRTLNPSIHFDKEALALLKTHGETSENMKRVS